MYIIFNLFKNFCLKIFLKKHDTQQVEARTKDFS